MELYFVHVLRLLISGICGVLIGFERTNRAKEAGLRTHCIVACASCLMMLVSIYGFTNIEGVTRGDPARIAAQIVSGIGFLGAGMVFVKRQTISGLTTAAGIWATAGIGMAIGCGMYIVGIAATLLILLAQTLLHFHLKIMDKPKNRILTVYHVAEENYVETMKKLFSEKNITFSDVNISKKEQISTYTFFIEMPHDSNEEDLISVISYDCSLKSD